MPKLTIVLQLMARANPEGDKQHQHFEHERRIIVNGLHTIRPMRPNCHQHTEVTQLYAAIGANEDVLGLHVSASARICERRRLCTGSCVYTMYTVLLWYILRLNN